MNENEEVAKLKLKKATFLLTEISVLMEHKYYNNVIARLYYSCFYATQALLLLNNHIPKTHKGVLVQLNDLFVKTGLFDKDKANFFSKLFNERIEDDYNEFLIMDEAEVAGFIEPSQEYVAYIETFFDKQSNS